MTRGGLHRVAWLVPLAFGCGTSGPAPRATGMGPFGASGNGSAPASGGRGSVSVPAGGGAASGSTAGHGESPTAGRSDGGTGGTQGGASSGGRASAAGGLPGGSGQSGGAHGGASTGFAGSIAAGGASQGGNATGGGSSGASAGGRGGGGTISVGTPQNPVLPGYNADPQVAFFGDRFYIYPTSDGYDNWQSTSFHAFSSNDLVAWKDEGVILDLTKDVSWASDRAWAPGIVQKNGVYYFYFSANLQIGVATSDSPTGPFKDALGKPLITTGEFGGQSIDPYAFIDDDGRAYLYFGSTSAGGHVVELGDDMTSLQGTPQQIAISGFKEGSVAFKRGGVYYFMWSEGDTRSADYDVAYGTGSSPMGPFTKAAINPILKKNTTLGILGTGHDSVLALPNGDYYIVYHRFAIPDGDGTHREVCIDRLDFNPDGSIVPVVPTP